MLKTVKSLTVALDLKLGRDGHFENVIAQIFNRKLLIFKKKSVVLLLQGVLLTFFFAL